MFLSLSSFVLVKEITFLIYNSSINKLWRKNGKGWETEHFISPLRVNIYQFKNNMLQVQSVFYFTVIINKRVNAVSVYKRINILPTARQESTDGRNLFERLLFSPQI